MNESYQKVVVVSLVALTVAAVVFGALVLQKLERITLAAERVEAKLDHIIKAAAPVGRAALKKGAEALEKMDAEDLGKSATEGVKEVGAAAKKRLIEYIEKKQPEPGNGQSQEEDIP